MKKALIFLLVAGGFVAGWFYFKRNAGGKTEEESRPTTRVETVPLKTQSITQTLHAFGVVAAAPSGEQVVAAAFDCVVRKVIASPGARVSAGDVLLEIDPSPETQLQLDAARSTLASAEKLLAAAKERYDLKLATVQDFLAAQQAEIEARQKAQSLETRGLGGNGTILAPIAGVVGKLEVSIGSGVAAGAVLATITSDTGLEVRLGVEVSDAAKVQMGQAVTLRSAHRVAAQAVVSTVRLTGSTLDPASGSVEVRVPVPPGAGLLLGEHVNATIELLTKNAFVVPRSAVLPDDDKWVLYTVKGGQAARHEVTAGIAAEDFIEVSGGDLREGDNVVTRGNYELSDGMTIQTAAAKEKAEEAKP